MVIYTERTDARGRLVICTVTDAQGFKHIGAARVMSKGEQDARDRAQRQAEEKARGAAE